MLHVQGKNEFHFAFFTAGKNKLWDSENVDFEKDNFEWEISFARVGQWVFFEDEKGYPSTGPMCTGSLGYSTENTPSKKTSLRWGDDCQQA